MEQACPKGEVGGLLTVTGRNLGSLQEGWDPCHSCLCPMTEGCPGTRCLALLAFAGSWQVLGRGDGREAKLKFLFEKLTSSQLKDSYLRDASEAFSIKRLF